MQTITNFGMAKQVVVHMLDSPDEKADCEGVLLAANTNIKLNKLPALIVLLAPLERLMIMMMTHGMVGQITMLQMQKLIVLYAHLVNTNTKQQTACIDCPAGTVRYSDNVDGNSWNGATNNDIADTKTRLQSLSIWTVPKSAGTTGM